jgi:hypothetical protein
MPIRNQDLTQPILTGLNRTEWWMVLQQWNVGNVAMSNSYIDQLAGGLYNTCFTTIAKDHYLTKFDIDQDKWDSVIKLTDDEYKEHSEKWLENYLKPKEKGI